MRAGLRFTTIFAAAGVGLLPASAFAQAAAEPPPAGNTSATDAVGPRELQNFSLPGTTTKPADQPAQTPASTSPTRNEAQPSATAPSSAPPAEAPRETARTAVPRPAPAHVTPPPLPVQTAGSQTQAMPPQPTAAPAPQPSLAAETAPLPDAPATGLAPEGARKLSFLPWLLAAIALAAGTIFLLWRRRPREALAGGPQIDLFAAPEPAPVRRPEPAPRQAPPAAAPKPVPAAPRPAAPATSGIVASRLRPSLEIGMQPLRCLVADDQVTLEFEIDLFNAGSAPARAVLAEASLLNAGGTQEQELSAFFANPVGAGERIDAIPPLKRVTLTSQVVAPRAAIQEYALAGRKAFVPVIAFNALYEWSGGQGQTSAAYLVGRETGHDKLGPMHLDQGAREFRAVGARPLPTALRT